MLDFAISAGITASSGFTPGPNCSIRAKIEYGVQATINKMIITPTIIVTRDSALLTRPILNEF